MIRTGSRHSGRAALAVVSSLLVTAGLGRLCSALWEETSRDGAASFDLLLGACAATAATAVAAWCALVLIVTAIATMRGRVGRAAWRVARLVAPAALRHRARLLLGVAVTAAQIGLAVSPAAAAGPGTGGGPVVSSPVAGRSADTAQGTSRAEPIVRTGPHAPAPVAGEAVPDLPPIGRPPVPPPSVVVPAPSPDRAEETEAPTKVTVRAGDTLWSIAADHLPSEATTQQVARAWPLWFAANRDVIGADPDLIRPGTVLVEPSADTDITEE